MLVIRLGPKTPQPEPQLQPDEIIKYCQQVSKGSGCWTLLHKKDKKLDILGGTELELYGRGIATNKQYKIGQKNTYCCGKKDAYSIASYV